MKKIIVSILALIPMMVFAQTGNQYVIEGKIGNSAQPLKVYLTKTLSIAGIIDSALVKNGKFKLKGTLKEPGRIILIAAKDVSGIPTRRIRRSGVPAPDLKSFYLDAGVTRVNSPDSLKDAVVSGASTKLNKESADFSEWLEPARGKQGAVGQLYAGTSKAEQATDAFKKKAQAMIQEADAYMQDLVIQFIKEHPGSMVSLDAIKGYMAAAPFDKKQKAFNALAENVKNTPSGIAYGQGLANEEKTAVGFLAADFSSKDVNGKTVKLSDFRGKYVLVDFWASWCVPCRKENPNLIKAYERYKDKNFEILGVSLDKDKAAWLKAIEADQLIWANVCDLKEFGGDAAKKYNIQAIPASFLIDPEGKIVGTNLRGIELEQALEQVL